MQSEIKMRGLEGNSFLTEVTRGFKQIGQFVGTYRILQGAYDVTKQMVNEVINIDSAMVELRKVSDGSDFQLAQSFD